MTIDKKHIGSANKDTWSSGHAWQCSCGKTFDSAEEWLVHRSTELNNDVGNNNN